MLVLHEASGLSDDIRRIADRFAGERYVALAPAMFGGPRCLMRTLRGRARNAGFDQWREWLRSEHGVDNAAVIGFCLGGGFALAYAATGAPVKAASSNYGFVPKDLSKVCPVVGSYGEDDRRLVPQARRLDAELDRLGIDHDVKIYPGAGHSFMNHHDGAFASLFTRVSPFPLGYHAEAAEDAWRRILAFFEKHLGPA